MNIPKSFIRTRWFEIGRTIIHRPTNTTNKMLMIEFYHKKISWWLSVYGIRFKHIGYYIMFKKTHV